MKLNEILESGLLELYVLGQLSGDELREVEVAIEKYPEVKSEIFEIEKALYRYDNIFNQEPPKNIIDNILSQIDDSNPPAKAIETSSKLSSWAILSGLLALMLLVSVFNMIQSGNKSQELINQQIRLLDECDEEKNSVVQKNAIYAAILDIGTKKILVAPTEKYPQTELVIHNNPSTKKNYLQISELPPLAANQSYQLWSLKGDSAPIPLDVFEDNTDEIIEVGYIDETNAYAITIEPRGGRETPTLENLIGIFSLDG